MSKQFIRGQKSQLSALTSETDIYVGIQLVAPGMDWDISCFGLDANNKLSDEEYFIFYNHPTSPDGSIQKLGPQSGDADVFRVALNNVPSAIGRLSFCAALDGPGSASNLQSGHFRLLVGGVEVMRYDFTGADFGTERAIIITDLYRKGVWRVGAVGQGFAGGLADLIRSYGGQVDDEPPPAPPAPHAQPVPPTQPVPPAQPAAQPAPTIPQYTLPPQSVPPQFAAPPPFAPAPPQQPSTQQFGMPPTQQFAAPPYQQPTTQQFGMPPQQPVTQQFGAPPPFAPTPPMPQAPGGYDQPGGYQQVQPGSLGSLQKYREAPTTGRWTKQNDHLVKVTLGPEAYARRGSMVAYQGNIEFDRKGSGGLQGMIEGAVTGQGLKLMTCKGQGEVFLAEDAADLHIVDLQGHSLCVNVNNVLAFDATLQTQVQRIESAGLPGGGMFHLLVSGQGTIVVMTHGTPVTLMCQGPTFADTNAVVAWTAGMRVSVSTQVRVSRQIYAGTSGESLALQFMGMQGHFVVVQPYEV